MTQRAQRPRGRLIPSRYWKIAERGWYVMLSVGALFIIWGAVLAGASAFPAVCGVCHGPQHSELSETAHADVGCDLCHREMTVFGLVESRLGVVRMGFDQVTPGSSSGEAHVDSLRCLGCHPTDQINQLKVSRGLYMSHKGLDFAVWPCTRCHATVAHGPASYRALQYQMEMCLDCHSTNPTNEATCQTCHPEGAPTGEAAVGNPGMLPSTLQVTHGESAATTHGMGDLDTCKACHASEFCVSCHEIRLPHSPTYLKEHGPELGEAPPDLCYSCHSAATCENCHGIEMPHPAGFLQDHEEETARSGQEACARCHKTESCDECHVKSTHPGLDPTVRERLRNRPVS